MLAIYRFLKKGGTCRAAAAKFGCGKTTAENIGSGQSNRDITGHSRIAPSVARKKCAKGYGRRAAHRSGKINCLGISAPKALVDEVARRLIEDPPFQGEWMAWWLARGREVISRDESRWATMMNVTVFDYLRTETKTIERNRKILELLKTKKVDFSNGQTIEWRVRCGPQQTNNGLQRSPVRPDRQLQDGDGQHREDHNRSEVVLP